MNQIEVLVKEKSTDDQRIFTYKSFLDLQDRFELIGQCDSEGNLIEGNPNLNPRHRKVTAPENGVVHAANPGMTMEEKLKMRDELLQKFTPPKVEPAKAEIKVEPVIPAPQRKKPGPKPKETA